MSVRSELEAGAFSGRNANAAPGEMSEKDDDEEGCSRSFQTQRTESHPLPT